MRRRDIVMLVGSAAAWPLASSAQPAVPVVGYLSGRSVNSETPLRTPFLKALEGAGFVVGQNVVIDYRFSDGRDERLPILAAELVQRQVTIVVATDRPSAVAAKAATNTIPLVFHSGEIQCVTAWFKASIALAAMRQASAC
jgi:putative ABC transport system substrate-binding protein